MYIKEQYFPHVAAIVKNYLLFHYSFSPYYNYNLTEETDEIQEYFPIVVLLGGVGGSGKSSFVNFCKKHHRGVYEESTIDCCKDIVLHMESLESRFGVDSLITDGYVDPELVSKSDKYRTFLHKIKSAWCEYNDGPNVIVCNKINYLLLNENPFLIFVNVREPEQINHLEKLIPEKTGCITITMNVVRNDPSSWSNDADKTTNNYAYDLTVENKGSLLKLEKAAKDFCTSVEYTTRKILPLFDTEFEGTYTGIQSDTRSTLNNNDSNNYTRFFD